MIAATSIGLGLIAFLLRSPVAYALVSTLILLAFGAASIYCGHAAFLLLGEAILFYNVGILASLAVLTLSSARRRRMQG